MTIKSDLSNHQGIRIIELTPDTIADYGVCGYKDIGKHLELRRKVDWFAKYYPLGLRIKALITQEGGYQGMMEYIPGEYAHRPVYAREYMFIHCIFVGFKKEFKGKGYASAMIDQCIDESKQAGLKGVAVVTRKGSFMADHTIFLKKGFGIVDRSKPDFELLALKLDESTESPSFMKMSMDKYSKGLFVLRSPQCPYSVKNVDAIIKTAKAMKLDPVLVELDSHDTAQQSPCAFGTFCIIHDGVVLSHHPISNTRFENIIKSKK
ncbi:MAG: YoaP domain-containing protein [Candidatus Delongbacteria bacterium]|nr:YoaP domain-containing protein [Candidatus Delongbacteria bacterium]